LPFFYPFLFPPENCGSLVSFPPSIVLTQGC
jgi:hypothetical protein